MILHALELRRYLIARIIERGGAASVANRVDDLADAGFEVAGRPSKTVSDALRPDVTRHRLVRLERGGDAEATIARSTRYRILAVARSLRSAAALSHRCETAATTRLTTVRQSSSQSVGPEPGDNRHEPGNLGIVETDRAHPAGGS